MTAPLVTIRTWEEREAYASVPDVIIADPQQKFSDFQLLQLAFDRLPESCVDPSEKDGVVDGFGRKEEIRRLSDCGFGGSSKVQEFLVEGDVVDGVDGANISSGLQLVNMHVQEQKPLEKNGNINDNTRQEVSPEKVWSSSPRTSTDDNLFTIAQVTYDKISTETRNYNDTGVNFPSKSENFTTDDTTVATSDGQEEETLARRDRQSLNQPTKKSISSLRENWFLSGTDRTNEWKWRNKIPPRPSRALSVIEETQFENKNSSIVNGDQKIVDEKDNLIEEMQVTNTLQFKKAKVLSTLAKQTNIADNDAQSTNSSRNTQQTTSQDQKKSHISSDDKLLNRISWRSFLDSKTHRLSSSHVEPESLAYISSSKLTTKSSPSAEKPETSAILPEKLSENCLKNQQEKSSMALKKEPGKFTSGKSKPRYREVGIDIGDLEKNLPKTWKDQIKEESSEESSRNENKKLPNKILNNQITSNLKPTPLAEDQYTANKFQNSNIFVESPSSVAIDNRISASSLDAAVIAPRCYFDEKDPRQASHHQGHFVVVAVDFGTTFSGYAFSFTRDPENIHMMRKWEGGDPGVTNQKTPTCLLLTPEGSFHSFGYTARDHYHDLDAQESKSWFFFDKFKMTLHNNMNLNRETELEATNKKTKPALTIFAHALRYFKEHALQELSDQSATKILNEDIRWVITVPAIWRQPAKQFMRQAAYEAGIASPEYPDQLLIALEPEAASIYCRKLRMNQLVPEALQKNRLSIFPENEEPNTENSHPAINDGKQGTRYIVVDCGGGTVDITVHEMTDKIGNLKELHKATGGPFGSVGVDNEFEKLIKEIFGADFIEQFKTKRSAGYVELMIAFEARKRNTSLLKINPLNISLPFSFIDYYRKYKGSSVESAIRKYGNKGVRWSMQGMLRLDPEVMCQLFRPVIKGILNHIKDVLSKFDSHTIQYLFLVGGFAESQILQQEIRNMFSSQLRVMIPQGVSLAILRGAVLYGLDPTVVCVRRSRLTYGVGVLNRFVHGVHPIEKMIIRDGQEWCVDVFDKFVLTDQSVGLGDTILRSYAPVNSTQKKIMLHIYCTENDQAQFVTDPGVRKCGTLNLILDNTESDNSKRREIQTRMIFGDTEIKVSTLDVVTQKFVRAEIDFLNL